MPPPLPAESETESVTDRQSTPRATPKATPKAEADANDVVMDEPKLKTEPDQEDEEEDSSNGDEEVYVVEKILDHRSDFEDGQVRYMIKWKGYEKKKDRTWETEENMFGAHELLSQYWRDIGGRPVPGSQKPKSGSARKSLGTKRSKSALKEEGAETESPFPTKKPKRGRKSNVQPDDEDTAEFVGYVNQGEDDWKPPTPKESNWDPILQKVDTIEQDESGNRWVYLCWNDKNADGRFYRSRARLPTVYKAAPQKMLFFYEQHLVFTNKISTNTNDWSGMNGDEL